RETFALREEGKTDQAGAEKKRSGRFGSSYRDVGAGNAACVRQKDGEAAVGTLRCLEERRDIRRNRRPIGREIDVRSRVAHRRRRETVNHAGEHLATKSAESGKGDHASGGVEGKQEL